MPRLPTASDFGATPSGMGGGGIVSAPRFQVSDRMGSISQAGDAVQEMGQAMQAAEEKLREARRSAQLSDAVGQATGELGELEVKYQQDTDFKTMTTRSAVDMENIRAKYEKGIDDPAVREAFNSHFQQLSTTKRINVLKMSVQKEGDYHAASMGRALDSYAKGAAFAANDAERDMIMQQAAITVHGMAASGWITREEAQRHEAGFMRKVDEARVAQDLFDSPGDTATKLQFNPDYGKNLDPLARQKLAEQGWSEVRQKANEERAEAEKLRQAQADEMMKNAADLDYKGKMSWGFINKARNIVSDSDYRALVHMMEVKAEGGGVKRDDPSAIIAIEEAMMRNPNEAANLAIRAAKMGQLRTGTMSSVVSRARTIDRQEGPKSEYETARTYIRELLAPPAMVTDPVQKARFGVAMREFEDFARQGNRPDQELRAKSDEIVKKYAMVDMTRLVERTGMGTKAAAKPDQVLEQIDRQGRVLMERRRKNEITPQEFNRERAKLQQAREAAEKARQLNGR